MATELKGEKNQEYLDYLSDRVKTIPNKSYTIKSGDTLSQIAKATGTTLAALKRANPDIKDLNKIRVGQKIKISAPVSNRKSVYQGMTKPEVAAIHIAKPKLDAKPPKKKPPIPAGLGAFTTKANKGSTAQSIKPRGWGKARYKGK
jgi:LysM repeat protein